MTFFIVTAVKTSNLTWGFVDIFLLLIAITARKETLRGLENL
jgi:hypothetical protein